MPNVQGGGVEAFRESRKRVPMSRSSFLLLASAKLTATYFRANAERDMFLDRRLEMFVGTADE